MSRRWDALVTWLHAPEPALWLGITRIAVGLVAAHALAKTWWTGAASWVWLDRAHGGYRGLKASIWFDGIGDGPLAVEGTLAAAVVACLALALGVGGPIVGRVVALLASQSFLLLADRNSHAGGSYDLLLSAALWLLVLAGPTQTLSLHARRTTGAWHDPEATAPRWTRLLVAWQLMIMYATTGWQKVSVHWVPGGDLSALYDILQQPTWSRYDLSWLSHPVLYAGTQVGTLVTWLWEVLTPVWAAWWLASTADVGEGRLARALRRLPIGWVWAGLGIVFHGVVHLLMDIGPFSWASLALYAAVVDPRTLARWANRGANRWATRNAPETVSAPDSAPGSVAG